MNKQSGFTLIELMIVIAIIAILAAIAIPQYQDYVSRTRAAGTMAELSGYRTAISACIAETLDVTQCDAGINGVPAVPAFTKNLTALAIANGVMTFTSGATTSAGVKLLGVDTPTTAGAGLMLWKNVGTICNPTRGLKPGQGDCP